MIFCPFSLKGIRRMRILLLAIILMNIVVTIFAEESIFSKLGQSNNLKNFKWKDSENTFFTSMPNFTPALQVETFEKDKIKQDSNITFKNIIFTQASLFKEPITNEIKLTLTLESAEHKMCQNLDTMLEQTYGKFDFTNDRTNPLVFIQSKQKQIGNSVVTGTCFGTLDKFWDPASLRTYVITIQSAKNKHIEKPIQNLQCEVETTFGTDKVASKDTLLLRLDEFMNLVWMINNTPFAKLTGVTENLISCRKTNTVKDKVEIDIEYNIDRYTGLLSGQGTATGIGLNKKNGSIHVQSTGVCQKINEFRQKF